MERVYNGDLRNTLGTFAMDAPLLAEGTAAATVKTTNAIDFCINGIAYSKAATDSIAIQAGAVQNVSTHCMYLVSIDKAGLVTTTKGVEAAVTADIFLPSTPALNCVIGAYKIVTDASTTYTAGTTDNGAAGITDTYFDLVRNWRSTFLGV